MKKTTLSKVLLEGLLFSEMIFKEETGFRFVEYVGEVEKSSTVKQLALFFNADTKTDTVLEVKKLLRNKEVEVCFDDEHLHLTFDNFLFSSSEIEEFETHHGFEDLTKKSTYYLKKLQNVSSLNLDSLMEVKDENENFYYDLNDDSLTSLMFTLISKHVSNANLRCELYDILDELERRIK